MKSLWNILKSLEIVNSGVIPHFLQKQQLCDVTTVPKFWDICQTLSDLVWWNNKEDNTLRCTYGQNEVLHFSAKDFRNQFLDYQNIKT